MGNLPKLNCPTPSETLQNPSLIEKQPVVQDRLITVAEAAHLLALSPYTLYWKAKRGMMESKRFGRSVRFKLSYIQSLIS